MAKVKIDVGATIDTLTKGELDDSLKEYRAQGDAMAQGAVRGIKYTRFPRITGTVYSGTLGSASGVSGNPGLGGQGPASGYAWVVRRFSVNGLWNAGSLIADTVGVYRNNPNGAVHWLVNASSPGVTFGDGGLVLLGGDTLWINNYPFPQAGGNTYGTLAATGNLAANWEGWTVPQEMLGKLM